MGNTFQTLQDHRLADLSDDETNWITLPLIGLTKDASSYIGELFPGKMVEFKFMRPACEKSLVFYDSERDAFRYIITKPVSVFDEPLNKMLQQANEAQHIIDRAKELLEIEEGKSQSRNQALNTAIECIEWMMDNGNPNIDNVDWFNIPANALEFLQNTIQQKEREE